MNDMPKPKPSKDEIASWLLDHVSDSLDINRDEINVSKPLEKYGVGSIEGVSLIGDLERWLGRSLDATMLWDHPTIDSLAGRLAELP